MLVVDGVCRCCCLLHVLMRSVGTVIVCRFLLKLLVVVVVTHAVFVVVACYWVVVVCCWVVVVCLLFVVVCCYLSFFRCLKD